MEVLIIEDDFSFALELEIFFEKLKSCGITKAKSFKEGWNLMSEKKWDLSIIDLSLDVKDGGITLAKLANELMIPYVILTAYKDTARFEQIKSLSPLAYFTKPVDILALEYLIFSSFLYKPEIIEMPSKNTNALYIKINGSFELININNIHYVEVEGNYVIINDKDRKIVHRSSLKSMITEYNFRDFIKIHRKYLVNKNCIKSFDVNNKLVYLDSINLPVSRNYRRNLNPLFSKSMKKDKIKITN